MRPAAALALVLAACGQPTDPSANAAQNALVVTLESEDAVAGQRPRLILICRPQAASLSLALVAVPEAEPDATAAGLIKFDDAAPVRIGLTWLGGDQWAPRLDHDQEAALVRAAVNARSLYFLGPLGRTERALRWDMDRLGPDRDRLRRTCG